MYGSGAGAELEREVQEVLPRRDGESCEMRTGLVRELKEVQGVFPRRDSES